ncbi:MAG: lysophospholipid acyltransferase family protein, partial [Aureliella sp.]
LAAVVWLGILVAVALGYMLLQTRRSPYTFGEDLLYAPTYLYGRIVWRVHFTNSPPPEMRGGAVLVANHRSSVDPFFVQLSAGRRVHWMVAKEYCQNIFFGPLLKALQVIPTNRSGIDTGATKQAIRLAKEGRLVGMFPEGRLNHTPGPLVSIRPGAALVAVRAGVPMIPLHIAGSPYRREVWSPLFMPARVRITFGRPVDPHAFAEQNAAATAATGNAAAESNNSDSSALENGGLENGELENGELESNGNGSPERDRKSELAMAEAMMLHWGRQIVAIAGRPNWPIEVAGRSRLARRSSASTQKEEHERA